MAAFITPSELYSYQVMPSGLRNAPAMFQNVVAGLAGCVYLDDVVVYSDSVRVLFDRPAEVKLTVNLSTCELAHAAVTYLGRVVGQVAAVCVKLLAIETFPQPITKKELMRFLGMVGYSLFGQQSARRLSVMSGVLCVLHQCWLHPV